MNIKVIISNKAVTLEKKVVVREIPTGLSNSSKNLGKQFFFWSGKAGNMFGKGLEKDFFIVSGKSVTLSYVLK